MSAVMGHPSRSEAVIARLTTWAEGEPAVRALLLTSSQATGVALDPFSDYDVVVVVEDPRAFVADERWLRAYGEPLVRFNDIKSVAERETFMRLVLYTDGTKIDYSVWPVAALRDIQAASRLPDGLDWGYRVLVDKDGLTADWPETTRTAYIPTPPTEQEYLALVEEFWWESTYVAKNLWRDELMFAKYNLEYVMKLDLLLRLLEWRVEIDHGWNLKPGLLGRGLKPRLPSDLWARVEQTYAGASIEDNWRALFATTSLFGAVAREVGEALGYQYPAALEAGVSAYLEAARTQPKA